MTTPENPQSTLKSWSPPPYATVPYGYTVTPAPVEAALEEEKKLIETAPEGFEQSLIRACVDIARYNRALKTRDILPEHADHFRKQIRAAKTQQSVRLRHAQVEGRATPKDVCRLKAFVTAIAVGITPDMPVPVFTNTIPVDGTEQFTELVFVSQVSEARKALPA